MNLTLSAIALDDIVLLEDDDRFGRDVKERLEARGCTVYWTKNGREALDYHADGAKCFILDLGIDDELGAEDSADAGLEVLQAIKAQDPAAFVAILTARGDRCGDATEADMFMEKSVKNMASQVDEIYFKMCSTEPDRDPNHQAFLRLMENEAWVQEHQGDYIGIVDAKPVAFDHDRKEVLRKLDKYPADVPKYYNLVQTPRPRTCVPTSFPRK